MYGQPINPKNAEFILFVDDGSSNNPMYIWGDGAIIAAITDLEDPSNDNIREVTGTVFDEAFPNNECEGVFKAKEGYFKNIEEARVLLLSIGMTQSYD